MVDSVYSLFTIDFELHYRVLTYEISELGLAPTLCVGGGSAPIAEWSETLQNVSCYLLIPDSYYTQGN